jgi:hypothetical protein
VSDERSRDAARKSESRAKDRDLIVPAIKDPARRESLKHDDAAWLRFYLPDVFYNPFTNDQLRMIEDVGRTLRYGTKKCKAAPRGGGKSSILKYLILKYSLERQINFALIIAATYSKAQKTTDSIKKRLASRQKSLLLEDYPLECTVARVVDPWPSRARNVTANGGRVINVEWGSSDGYFILPSWEDEEPIGPIIMSLGWSSDELQGCNLYDRRPGYVALDDLDSRSSLASEDGGAVAAKIEETIEKTVAGMIGPGMQLGQYMLCTITSESAAAFTYSDPEIKPSWEGERVRAISKWPDNMKLWDQYIWLRQKGQKTGDSYAREAHQFYVDNREAMDAGAVVSNPYDFNGDSTPDGTPAEISNLQKCFNFIADVSREAFDTEYQNDPPSKSAILETKVTTYHVASSAGQLERLEVDPSTTIITRAVDVRKIELHYAALAMDDVRNNRIIDYGIREHGNSETTVEQAEELILDALRNLADHWEENKPCDSNGTQHSIDLTLIDKGWMGNWTEDGVVKTWASQPVEQFCMEMGLRRWLPAKGQANYQSPAPSDDRIVGNHWHMNRGEGQNRRCTEVIWDAQHWHLLVEELFMLDKSDPDKFELFVSGDGVYTNHKAFSEHITVGAKQLKDQLSRGTMSRKPKFIRNHWYDATAMMLVAQSIEQWFRVNLVPRKRRTNQGQPSRMTETEEIGAR